MPCWGRPAVKGTLEGRALTKSQMRFGFTGSLTNWGFSRVGCKEHTPWDKTITFSPKAIHTVILPVNPKLSRGDADLQEETQTWDSSSLQGGSLLGTFSGRGL